jgi:small subunit ribosomal protein S17
MIGRVVSTKMEKTAVVLVESQKKHPLYKKSFLRTKKFLVDDPFNVKDGDIVVFQKIRPISKLKHFQITKVLGSDIVSLEQAELKEEAAEAIAEVMPEEKEEKKADEAVESLEASVEVEDKKPKTKEVKPKTEKKPVAKTKVKAKKGEAK